jgi:hypothetical protein
MPMAIPCTRGADIVFHAWLPFCPESITHVLHMVALCRLRSCVGESGWKVILSCVPKLHEGFQDRNGPSQRLKSFGSYPLKLRTKKLSECSSRVYKRRELLQAISWRTKPVRSIETLPARTSKTLAQWSENATLDIRGICAALSH